MIIVKKVEELKVELKIEYLFRKIDGYKYYICFEYPTGTVKEYLTNNKELFDSFKENKWYKVEYEATQRYVDRRGAGIIVDMKYVKNLGEV